MTESTNPAEIEMAKSGYATATAITPAAEVQYAGFMLRLVASLIDTAILMVFGAVAGFVSGAIGINQAFIQGVVLLTAAAYFVVMECGESQATIGKMVMKVKVVNLTGGRISVGQSLGRYFGKIISGAILCMGYLMASFTEKKQALHDMMASTLVIRNEG